MPNPMSNTFADGRGKLLAEDTVAQELQHAYRTDDTDDTDGLSCARAFVGFCPTAALHLGTRDSLFGAIQYSPLPEARSVRRLGLKNISLGGSVHHFAFDLTSELTQKAIVNPAQVPLQYEDVLGQMAKDAIIFYDAGDQRAWLVPAAAAILHLMRAWMFKRGLPEGHLPYVEPGPDVGGQALAQFREHRGLPLDVIVEPSVTTTTSSSSPAARAPYRVEHLVTDLWQTIQGLHRCARQNQLEDRISIPTFSLRTSRRFLQGWEFWDLVDRRDPPTKAATHGWFEGNFGWEGLTENVVTIVGVGFGQIIRPSNASNETNASWPAVPTGQHLLTAMISSLCDISRRRGRDPSTGVVQLTAKQYWRPTLPLMCDPSLAPPPNRPSQPASPSPWLQRLQSISWPSVAPREEAIELPINGAVVFSPSTVLQSLGRLRGQVERVVGGHLERVAVYKTLGKNEKSPWEKIEGKTKCCEG
ncbi:MAG: hypothetical protein M1823_002599 [Watsoniomyces obsoletus]|nr:MAG: hypothetical protein M1823_002599 [Watsoniomyces obsoletus]